MVNLNKNLEEIERGRPRKKNGEYLTQIEYERMKVEEEEKRNLEGEIEKLKRSLKEYDDIEEKLKISVIFFLFFLGGKKF